jgi:hypothetical protein
MAVDVRQGLLDDPEQRPPEIEGKLVDVVDPTVRPVRSENPSPKAWIVSARPFSSSPAGWSR